MPRWKHYAVLSWDSGPWAASIAQSYQSGYVDVNVDNDGNTRRVSSMSLWDLQGSWSGWKGLTVSLGVKNLFDRNPPLTNQNLTFQAGYDPNYYDARARVLYTTIRYMFR